MTIALSIIVKNEEKNLLEFLAHHNKISDEIIVVDTGSTDSTVEIAKRFTDKVYSIKWNDDFSRVRNVSIAHATKEWVLWLDPDERISEKDFLKMRELTENKEYLGYSFIQKNYTNVSSHQRFVNDEKEGYKGYYIRRICKLFQNHKGIEFEYPVHETVMNSIKRIGGKIGNTDIVIEHFPEKKGKSHLIKKEKHYLKLLDEKKKKFPLSNADKERESEKRILEHFETTNKGIDINSQ